MTHSGMGYLPNSYTGNAMRIDLKTSIKGLERVQAIMDSLSGAQLAKAQTQAINDAAYLYRRNLRAEMAQVFDRPTTYILNSIYVNEATPDKIVAQILPTYYGGKGIDPQQILAAEAAGGTRRDKRSEVALSRVGILPSGYQTAIPKTPLPGSDDGRGNLRGPFLVQLLSYFAAFSEQGYRANMTQRRKAAVHSGGIRYIVAYGKTGYMSRVTASLTRAGVMGKRSSNLKPGIWAVTGAHGEVVKPVLMFVRRANYTARLDLKHVAEQADLSAYLSKRMRYRIRQAAGI